MQQKFRWFRQGCYLDGVSRESVEGRPSLAGGRETPLCEFGQGTGCKSEERVLVPVSVGIVLEGSTVRKRERGIIQVRAAMERNTLLLCV